MVGVGAAAGAAVGGGFKSALNQQATTKILKGLYGDAQLAQATMEGLNGVAKKVALAPGDLMKTAEGLAYAGVKGDEATESISNVAHAIVASGGGRAQLDSFTGGILNMVNSGRVGLMELNQVSKSGVPIYASLAEHFGVSADELKSMVSDGKVGLEDVMAVISKGDTEAFATSIRAGEEAMKSLGNTGKRAWNILTTELGSRMQPALNSVTDVVVDLVDKFEVWLPNALDKVSGAVDWIKDAFSDAKGSVEGFGGVFESIGEWISTVKDIAGDFISGFLEGFGGLEPLLDSVKDLLPLLLGPLGLVRDALLEVFGDGGIDFGAFAESIGESLGPILELLGELAGMLSGALADALEVIIPIAMDLGATLLEVAGSLLEQLVPVIGDLITGLLPPLMDAFAMLVPVVLSLFETLAPLIGQLIEMLVPILLDLVTALLPPLISLFDTLVPAIMEIIAAIMPLVEVLLEQLIPPILEIVGAVLPPLLGIFAEVANLIAAVVVPIIVMLVEVVAQTLIPIIEALLPVVTTVFETVADIIGGVMKVVQGIIKTVTGIIKGDWSQAWDGIKMIFSGVWDTMKSIVTGAINIVKSLISGLWTAAKGLFTSGIKNVLSILKSLPAGIGKALSGLLSMGLDAGKALIGGLKDGVLGAFNGVVDAVKGGLSKIRNLLPFSPAKEGPFSGKGYTSYSGQAMIRDLAKGIEGEGSTLYDAMDDVLGGVDTDLEVNARTSGRGGAGGGALGGIQVAGPLVQVDRMDVRDESDIRRISQELQKMIDARFRSMGRASVGVA